MNLDTRARASTQALRRSRTRLDPVAGLDELLARRRRQPLQRAATAAGLALLVAVAAIWTGVVVRGPTPIQPTLAPVTRFRAGPAPVAKPVASLANAGECGASVGRAGANGGERGRAVAIRWRSGGDSGGRTGVATVTGRADDATRWVVPAPRAGPGGGGRGRAGRGVPTRRRGRRRRRPRCDPADATPRPLGRVRSRRRGSATRERPSRRSGAPHPPGPRLRGPSSGIVRCTTGNGLVWCW